MQGAHLRPTPSGLLLIDKEPGYTSMDVCAIVRTRLRRGGAPKRIKVGHGGTLDPLATGLLVVLVGKATPLCSTIMAGEKEYVASVDLSRVSETDDEEGPTRTLEGVTPPSRERVLAALASLTGDIQQRPPAFSAIKQGGRRAYEIARGGGAVVLPARTVTVHEVELLAYDFPRLSLRIRCGKGTYIRSIARDLGPLLGTGGMLTSLRRTRVGRWSVEGAKKLGELPEVLGQSNLILP
jgi:tRNA pseudouridine55 synthase